MFDYSKGGVLLASMLDTRRKIKNGKYPVKIRVTYKRKRVYYGTGISLTVKEWEGLASKKSNKAKEVKADIKTMFERVEAVTDELIRKDTFSFETLKVRLKIVEGTTVNQAFRNKIDTLFNDGKISTSEWYGNTLDNIEKFAGENISFEQITVKWLNKFETYLLAEEKSLTTVSMFMRALRAIINGNDEISRANYPFGKDKYRIPEPNGRAMALTLKQIGSIVNYECKNDTMRRCRDMWFFSYLCNGANITDICKLKFKNIENGEIYFYRQKVKGKGKMKEIRAVVTDEMQAIIDEWGNERTNDNDYIFPIITGDETPAEERKKIKYFIRHLNEYTGQIGKALDIGHITTYNARHSFATVLKRSGANISYISESLGHSSLQTTENYLAKFESEERQKQAKVLTNF